MASPVSSPLRVAIAGLGFGLKVHLPALRDCPDTEPVALWHPGPERLEQGCQASGLPGSTDFAALLADPHIEALVIATPPEPRLALARTALEAGKHLLLEKPVALNSTDIAELQRLALARGLCVGVDFEYRAVPLFQQLARLLEQGVLGDLWLVKLDWLMSSRADASRPWSWYSSKAAGGGVLGALGTHAFDILGWLVGPAHGIQSKLSTAIRKRPQGGDRPPAEVDAEDIALLQMELEERSGRM
ncbi:MAG: Gfo/Idh/MocA family oxidoreductase, partial [Synechococcaceae cyanobacterium]|nr:Gfo/Idh/MocA family oxidoreductase [Synechococcaceae cyanobacterium]